MKHWKDWTSSLPSFGNGSLASIWCLQSPWIISGTGISVIPCSLPISALDAKVWVDLGSGGGFPGLVVAAEMARIPHFRMILVESNGKKCAFLRETSRLADLPVEVVNGRIENVIVGIGAKQCIDVVSARALAPLSKLLDYVEPLLKSGAMAIFPKGQDVDGELADASRAWNLDINLIQSQTEPDASIVVVRSGSRKPLQPQR